MRNVLKGLLYGSFSIVPGLSGSMLASQLNDYDKLIDILINKKFNLNNNIYIASIAFGFLIGVVLLSNILLLIFNKYAYPFRLVVLFINIFILILTLKNHREKLSIIIISLLLFLLLYCFISNVNFTLGNGITYILIVSFLYAFGKVVPGVSTTSLLINTNSYELILHFFSNPGSSYFNNLLFWTMFWIMFLLFAFLLLKLVYRYKNKLNLFLIDVQIINIIMLLK